MVKEQKQRRISLRIDDKLHSHLSDIRELTGLSSEGDAARYLITRGLEAMGGQLASLRLFKRMETELTPEQIMLFTDKIKGS